MAAPPPPPLPTNGLSFLSPSPSMSSLPPYQPNDLTLSQNGNNANNNADTQNTNNSSSIPPASVKINTWDRQWSLQELRTTSNNWTLATDAGVGNC